MNTDKRDQSLSLYFQHNMKVQEDSISDEQVHGYNEIVDTVTKYRMTPPYPHRKYNHYEVLYDNNAYNWNVEFEDKNCRLEVADKIVFGRVFSDLCMS